MADITILEKPTPAQLLSQLDILLDVEDVPLTLMANFASLLYWSMDEINWLGFYLLDRGVLRLGPFHGRPACTRIATGRGVCGTAAAERRVLNVPDVLAFPGHIACDAASRSELVIPLIGMGRTAAPGFESEGHDREGSGRLIGVLDVASPMPDRFDPETEHMLTHAASLLLSRIGDRRVSVA